MHIATVRLDLYTLARVFKTKSAQRSWGSEIALKATRLFSDALALDTRGDAEVAEEIAYLVPLIAADLRTPRFRAVRYDEARVAAGRLEELVDSYLTEDGTIDTTALAEFLGAA